MFSRKEAVVIAWINGKWHVRESRERIIDEISSVIAEVDPDDVPLLPEDVQRELFEKANELERLERIHRCETNLIEFALEYFSEARNPGNDGNWDGFDITCYDEAPEFHREICGLMDDVSNVHTNDKVAEAAPRSHAKSTYLSKAFPIREIVYRKRMYAILISETPTVSSANLDWIALQLKSNAKLRADFGPLLSPKQQENPKDNSSEFIAWEPREDGTKKMVTKVEAASTGQALRGRNWNGVRPDLIICDDLEDARPGGNASTPELRRKLKDWFTQTVVPLGDPKGKKTAFVYMGTTVHHEALLVDVLYNRSDFKSRVYRAVIEWPERMDLWEACRLVYKDPDRPKEERVSDARALYESNREDMDRGSVVLWPEAQPLWKLMTWKWDNGTKAFNTEYMNNPVDEESMIFNPDKFEYWDGKEIEFSSREFDFFMGVDFAMGKTRGDYSAIVTVAKNRDTGAIYVVDAYGERVHPDVFLKVIVKKVMSFQPTSIAAEAQAAQEFFVQKLKESLHKAGYPSHSRVKEVHQRTRKDLRIEALLPDIESGTIIFSRKHSLLLEQFELYGSGSHDDLPDALTMAIDASKRGRKKRIRRKPAWL